MTPACSCSLCPGPAVSAGTNLHLRDPVSRSKEEGCLHVMNISVGERCPGEVYVTFERGGNPSAKGLQRTEQDENLEKRNFCGNRLKASNPRQYRQ